MKPIYMMGFRVEFIYRKEVYRKKYMEVFVCWDTLTFIHQAKLSYYPDLTIFKLWAELEKLLFFL